MDVVKNIVLSLLRAESAKRKPAKRKALRCESVKFSKNESKDQWYFRASDMGMSGVPTYTLNTPVRLEDGDVYVLADVDIMSPDLGAAVGEEGYFILYQAEEDVYGFQADFGEDGDTMIYFYGSLDETKECIEELKGYISGLPDDINTDIDEFVKLIEGGSEANEDEDFSIDDVSIDVQEPAEPTINEGSKEYVFHVPCEATITVVADSEDLAKEVLARETSIEVEEDVVKFANGDATLRAVDFDMNALNDLQPDSMASMD